MKKASHHAMGHLLHQALEQEGIFLDHDLFVLGNVLPDYMPEIILLPHFSSRCQCEIELFAEVLAAHHIPRNENIPPEYALRLGILCHYITDSFCFPHNQEFGHNLKKHDTYERELDAYFRAHYTVAQCKLAGCVPLPCACAKDVAQNVFIEKERYLAARRGYATDVRFAFTACFRTLCALLALSESTEQICAASSRFSPFAAEKYAFKSNIRRRMIVPRRAWCLELESCCT